MTTPPPDLPAERLTALRDIAKAANDGPWTAEPYSFGVQDGRIRVTSPTDSGIYNLAEDVTEADAAHIAAFDPPTVLALIDRVGHLEMKRKKYNAAIARAEAAEAKVAAVREALEAHPKACDRRAEDDPIKCGWKRAVADVTHALDSTPYRTLSTEPLVSTHHTPETETAP